MADVGSSSLVTVSCADYSQYVAIALRNLFDSRRGTDFELKWEGMSIRAHRVILEMFLSTETLGCPVQDPVGVKQEVPDCDAASGSNVLESLLEFLYKGEVTVQKKILEDLFRVSNELDFKMFEVAVVQYCNSEVENELYINENNFINCSESSGFVTASCDNYGQYVVIALRNLFDSRRGTDFDLNWEGYTVRTHRIILELFLSTETMECCLDQRHGPPVIKQEVPDGDCNIDGNNVLESLLEFLYKGEVTVPEEQLGDLLRASKELDFKMLEDAIGEYFLKAENELDIEEEYASVSVEMTVNSRDVNLEKRPSNLKRCTEVENHEKDVDSLCGSPGDSKLYKCQHCEFETLVGLNYRRHVLTVHGINSRGEPRPKHKCPQCKFETFVATYYRQHLVATHGITDKGEPAPMLKCPHCKYETLASSNYRRHLINNHKVTPKGEPASKRKCPHCEFETLFLSSYGRHLATAHGINPKGNPAPTHKCPHCKYETLIARNYHQHLATTHGRNTNGKQRPKHKCPHCAYETFVARYYSQHLVTNHGIHGKYETLVATKRLKNKPGKNSKGKPRPVHKCQHCEFKSFFGRNLRRHLAAIHGIIASGEPAPLFKCSHCKYETVINRNYRQHLVTTHGIDANGEPAPLFKCSHCEYATLTTTNYRRHLVNHHKINVNGEPASKRKCPHCEFETFVARYYSQHLVTTHGINSKGKPAPMLKCLHCEYETLVARNYRQHLAATHGMTIKGKQMPKHKCPHCEFETFVSRSYSRHLVAIHGKNAKGELGAQTQMPAS